MSDQIPWPYSVHKSIWELSTGTGQSTTTATEACNKADKQFFWEREGPNPFLRCRHLPLSYIEFNYAMKGASSGAGDIVMSRDPVSVFLIEAFELTIGCPNKDGNCTESDGMAYRDCFGWQDTVSPRAVNRSTTRNCIVNPRRRDELRLRSASSSASRKPCTYVSALHSQHPDPGGPQTSIYGSTDHLHSQRSSPPHRRSR